MGYGALSLSILVSAVLVPLILPVSAVVGHGSDQRPNIVFGDADHCALAWLRALRMSVRDLRGQDPQAYS